MTLIKPDMVSTSGNEFQHAESARNAASASASTDKNVPKATTPISDTPLWWKAIMLKPAKIHP